MNIVSEINDPAAIEAHLLLSPRILGTWARDQNNYGTEDRWIGEDAATAVGRAATMTAKPTHGRHRVNPSVPSGMVTSALKIPKS